MLISCRKPAKKSGPVRARSYRDEVMAAIHETASGLHDVGAIDKQTMREFDDICLTPVRLLKANEIRALREREHVSQSVFAQHLNVHKGLISQWERGERRPSGPALMLLSLIKRKGLNVLA